MPRFEGNAEFLSGKIYTKREKSFESIKEIMLLK